MKRLHYFIVLLFMTVVISGCSSKQTYHAFQMQQAPCSAMSNHMEFQECLDEDRTLHTVER